MLSLYHFLDLKLTTVLLQVIHKGAIAKRLTVWIACIAIQSVSLKPNCLLGSCQTWKQMQNHLPDLAKHQCIYMQTPSST